MTSWPSCILNEEIRRDAKLVSFHVPLQVAEEALFCHMRRERGALTAGGGVAARPIDECRPKVPRGAFVASLPSIPGRTV